jgi:quinol monooxygenase YgiN
MSAGAPLAAAPPFVSYSVANEAVVPAELWQFVYASLQTYKAHVQEYPGCQRFDVYVSIADGDDTRLHCYSTWDTPEQLEAFLERGYTFERLLADLQAPAPERTLIMEKVF